MPDSGSVGWPAARMIMSQVIAIWFLSEIQVSVMEVGMDDFALRSRVVFIDSCIFYANNYQFFSKDLASLTDLLERDEASLVLVNVTVAEVKKHLRAQSKEAASAAQSFREKGKVLRNIPAYASSLMFDRVDAGSIESELFAGFERFLSTKNIEIISVDLASAEDVFTLFFDMLPPFSDKKQNEFRDAFVLEALKAYAAENNLRIHIISSDADMCSYCSGSRHLFWSSNLGEVVNALAHTARDHPLDFADKALNQVLDIVQQMVGDWLVDYDFTIDLEAEYDMQDVRFSVSDIKATNIRVFSAKNDCSVHGVDFEFKVSAEYWKLGVCLGFISPKDVDPTWQKEIHTLIYRNVLSAQLSISYFEGDLESVVLDDWEFELIDGGFLEFPLAERVVIPKMYPMYDD